MLDKNDDFAKYCDCMEEVKRRTHTITTMLDGSWSTPYKATNVEFGCLQLRKTLELIALASIAANKEEYARQRAKFDSDWHAERIIRDLEKVNPNFYPKPTIQIADEATGKVVETIDREEDYLTKDLFAEVYSRCSEVLHATNPYDKQADYGVGALLPNWNQKIVNLLNHHQIQLIDQDYQLWVLMNSKDDGRVHAFTFQRIGDGKQETDES